MRRDFGRRGGSMFGAGTSRACSSALRRGRNGRKTHGERPGRGEPTWLLVPLLPPCWAIIYILQNDVTNSRKSSTDVARLLFADAQPSDSKVRKTEKPQRVAHRDNGAWHAERLAPTAGHTAQCTPRGRRDHLRRGRLPELDHHIQGAARNTACSSSSTRPTPWTASKRPEARKPRGSGTFTHAGASTTAHRTAARWRRPASQHGHRKRRRGDAQ